MTKSAKPATVWRAAVCRDQVIRYWTSIVADSREEAEAKVAASVLAETARLDGFEIAVLSIRNRRPVPGGFEISVRSTRSRPTAESEHAERKSVKATKSALVWRAAVCKRQVVQYWTHVAADSREAAQRKVSADPGREEFTRLDDCEVVVLSHERLTAEDVAAYRQMRTLLGVPEKAGGTKAFALLVGSDEFARW